MITLSQLLAMTCVGNCRSNYRAAMHGLMLPMLAEHPIVAMQSVDWHYRRLERAIDLEQVKLYFDRFGRCCGYAWWTQVSSQNEDRILQFGPEALAAEHFCTEGKPWIVDLWATFGRLPEILLDLCEIMWKLNTTISYCRYKNGKRMLKSATLCNEAQSAEIELAHPESAETYWLCSDDGKPSLEALATILRSAVDCGKAVGLLVRVARYAKLPLPAILRRLRPALECRQYRLLCSPAGEPESYCSWLWREVTGASACEPILTLELSDWHDGRDAWLCDAVMMRGCASNLQQELSTVAPGGWLIYPDNSQGAPWPTQPLRVSSNDLLAILPADEAVFDLAAWWHVKRPGLVGSATPLEDRAVTKPD